VGRPIVETLYTSRLDDHAVAVSRECALPDFAGTPSRVTPGVYWRTLRHMRVAQLYHLARKRLLPTTNLRRWCYVPIRLRTQLPPSLISQWKPEEAKRLLAQNHIHRHCLQPTTWQEQSRFGAELSRMSNWRANCFDFVNVDLTAPADAPLLRQALRQIVKWWHKHSTSTQMRKEPLALSLRILNWLKFVARNSARATQTGDGAMIQQILESLRLQALLLERCREKHR
jgi:hypothetical protein